MAIHAPGPEAEMAPMKFTFDTAFGEEAREQQEAELAALRRRVEAAREEGRREGAEAGRRQAKEEIEAQIAAALERLVSASEALFERQRELQATLESRVAVIAHAVASKLAPALMARHPLAEIEALVTDCLDACRREPRIVVRVAEDLLDPLAERIRPLQDMNGFPGEIVLLSDSSLGSHDCRVEWPDGGAERDMEALEREISSAVERFASAAGEAEALDARPRMAKFGN